MFITHKITGELKVLPLQNKAIESVIGIERICAVIENKNTVYDIEDVANLRNLIQYDSQSTLESVTKENRIIDHIRALCFLIPEGAPQPGRNGRARIIRKLMRELLTDLYVFNLNSIKTIEKLATEIIYIYKNRYPELQEKEEQIIVAISNHEKVYQKTLEKAGRAINRFLKKNEKNQLDKTETEYFKKQFGVPSELQEKYSRMMVD